MKNLIRRCAIGAAVACSALVVTSCYYDPAVYGSTGYASPAPPANYSYGFGAGYGYGHPRFSTSFFVSTGDPRWGYDPYSYSYYDYVSHRYYDPYLNGYYPYGYRPRVIYGVPHVHGYRHGYAPPPRHIRNHVIVGYRDRVGSYRRQGYNWSRNVGWERPRANVIGNRPSRDQGNLRSSRNYRSPYNSSRPNVTGSRTSRKSAAVQPRTNSSRYQSASSRRYSNTPVTVRGNRNDQASRIANQRNQGSYRASSPPRGSRAQQNSRSAPRRQQASPYRNQNDGKNQSGRRF